MWLEIFVRNHLLINTENQFSPFIKLVNLRLINTFQTFFGLKSQIIQPDENSALALQHQTALKSYFWLTVLASRLLQYAAKYQSKNNWTKLTSLLLNPVHLDDINPLTIYSNKLIGDFVKWWVQLIIHGIAPWIIK